MNRLYLMDASLLEEETYFTKYLALVEPERQEKLKKSRQKNARALGLAAGLLASYAALEADLWREKKAEALQEEEAPILRTVTAQEAAERLKGTGPAATQRTASGKPFYADRPGLFFNLSHSGGYAVCAISHRPVGVDIQKRRNVNPGMWERILCADKGDRQEERSDFFRLWSAKEACVKCTGAGLSRSFQEFFADLDRGEIEDMVTGERFLLYNVEALLDYSLAVCIACGR